MTVTASGFFMSLPSLAKILLNDTPTDTVMPSSRFTRSRMSWAIRSPSRIVRPGLLRSIHASSSPKDSTRSEYSSYSLRIRLLKRM